MVATPPSTAKPKLFHDWVGAAEPRNALILKNLSSPPKERRIHEHRGRPADLYVWNQWAAPGGLGEARGRGALHQPRCSRPGRLPELRALYRASRRRCGDPASAAGHHGRDRAAAQYGHPREVRFLD